MERGSEAPRARHTRVLAWVLYCQLLATSAVAAESCRVVPLRSLQSFELTVGGDDQVWRDVSVPAMSDLAISASEAGIDVVLTLRLPDSTFAAADNPVRRIGPQLSAVRSDSRGQIGIGLRGTQHDAVAGRVRIDIVQLAPQGASACDDALQTLAQGDDHYARAQLIASGKTADTRASVREEYQAAVRSYEEAARALEPAGPSPLLAHAIMSAAAATYQGVQDWSAAAVASRRAQSAFEALGDDYGSARARAMEAAAQMEVAVALGSATGGGRPASASALLESSRATFTVLARLHQRRAEPFDQALALNNLGLTLYYEGRFTDALQAFASALPLCTQLHETRLEAQVVQNAALVQHDTGQFARARIGYARALELINPQDNAKLYADVLNNQARAEYALGELDESLAHYSAAFNILVRLQAHREQARSLHGIGTVYYLTGDRDLAADYFSRALPLRPAQLDGRGRLATLRALGNALHDSGKFDAALSRHREALALAVSAPLKVRILVQIARDYAALGQPDLALAEVERALTLASSQDRLASAQALAMRASLALTRNDWVRASNDVQAAISVFKALDAPVDEFNARVLNARIEQARGNLKHAKAAADAALGLAEQVRLQSDNPELRAGLWTSVRPAFDLEIQLLTQTAASTKEPRAVALAALRLAEQSRGRALADYRRLSLEGRPSLDANAQARRQSLYSELAQRRFQLDAALERQGDIDNRVTAIRADIATLKRDIDVLNASLAGARGNARRASPAPDSRLPEMIGPDAAVVEYSLGENIALAWALSGTQVEMIQLGKSNEIRQAALALHASLSGTAGAEERAARSQRLYDLVIAPLPAWVLRRKALTFVPDDALNRVPFAVLARRNGQQLQYLVADHDIAIAPSLAELAQPDDPSRAPWATGSGAAMLMVSDPVYSSDDERVSGVAPGRRVAAASRGDGGDDGAGSASSETEVISEPSLLRSANRNFRRLPGASREAQAIESLFAPGATERLDGFGASRAAFLSRDLSRYRYIHIASHAVSDGASPKLSRLVLSTVDRDGRPQVGDVFAGDLALRRLSAELIVFSGCETALGSAVAGEGVLGLEYAAHASGAQSAIASLWQVSDRVSQELMTDFYTALLRERQTPRAALARAMRRTLGRYSDPVLWGSFQLSISSGARLN